MCTKTQRSQTDKFYLNILDCHNRLMRFSGIKIPSISAPSSAIPPSPVHPASARQTPGSQIPTEVPNSFQGLVLAIVSPPDFSSQARDVLNKQKGSVSTVTIHHRGRGLNNTAVSQETTFLTVLKAVRLESSCQQIPLLVEVLFLACRQLSSRY